MINDSRVEAIRGPGDQQGHDVRDCIRRDDHELGVERSVSKTGDYLRKEKRETGERR